MRSRRLRDSLCVYCCERRGETKDHVFAKGFFLPNARDNLPLVPACQRCNNEKAKLELYLTAVLPFGGQHPDANANLLQLVPGRLAKNARLHRELQAGGGTIWYAENNVMRAAMTIPVDPARINSLFALTARALAWHHWGLYLSPESDGAGLLLSSSGRAVFDRAFAMNGDKARQDLGRGAVRYTGIRSDPSPQLTLWRIQFYGGIKFSGDPNIPDEVTSEIGALTGSRRLIARLMGV